VLAKSDSRGVHARRDRICSFLVALGLSLCACRTTSHSVPAGGLDAVVTRARRTQSWEAREDGTARGYVVRHETREQPVRFFFLVQSLQRQDLGMIDAQGRAWRYRPHASEPDWLVSGTVAHGAAAILGCSAPVELVEQR
jgi:hypothetical protein